MIKNIIFFMIACFFGANSFAIPYDIKLAVFDNPRPDPSRAETTQALEDSYLAGINTAIKYAERQGIYIEEKDFFHEDGIYNIIQQAANVKSWAPDVIIGFNASNEFLMATAFFGDQITLSISATDQKLSTLPKNFYSLGIPDSEVVKVIIKFINKQYHQKNIFITVAAESKESIDIANLLAANYQKQNPACKVTIEKYLTEDINNLNYKIFLKNYRPDDIIVAMSTGYYSGIDLMNKITNYFQDAKLVFITASDNWGNDSTPEIVKGNYDAFRIDTLSGGEGTDEYKKFIKNYQEIYHKLPEDTISFVTYRAVVSFIAALKKYPPPENLSSKNAILWSYQKALRHDPNWFRPRDYVVYKLTPLKEVYFETLAQPTE